MLQVRVLLDPLSDCSIMALRRTVDPLDVGSNPANRIMYVCPIFKLVCNHGYLPTGNICGAYLEPISVGFEFLNERGYIHGSHCVIFNVV